MKYLGSLILAILVISCKPTKNESNTTYFGGEIVNPRSNFVLFLKDDKVIDTLQLDSKHRFITTFKHLKEGLYTFKHGLEFQYIYLEPTDSVLVRLNTWDFDESLVYSGKGSSKNEFLINLFLQNKEEEKAMYGYFNLNEVDFQSKLDSLAHKRETIYNSFASNEENISKGFQKLINVAIHYPLYRLKEIYPFYYKKRHNLNKFPKISAKFYAFRNHLNLNETNLLSFYPYQNYIINYLYHLGHQLAEKDSLKNNISVNVLNAVVAKIKSEEIKNTLLKRIVVNDFLKSKSTCTINNEVLSIFTKYCTDKMYLKQVNNLVNDSKYIENKKPLPSFNIVNYKNAPNKIKDIIKNKKSVIYFWSTEYMSPDYLVSRIKYLERKHPNIQFIGIQMHPAYLNVTNEPKLKLLHLGKQYKLTANSFANNFLTSNYPRIIIINNDGLVMNGFAHLGSRKLSKELIKLEIN